MKVLVYLETDLSEEESQYQCSEPHYLLNHLVFKLITSLRRQDGLIPDNMG